MNTQVQNEFVGFWTQTYNKVRAYMFCACRNASDADDLTQECYMRAFRMWEALDYPCNRQAWLFAIARNVQIDWFRKQVREGRAIRKCDSSNKIEVSFEPICEETEAIWLAIKRLGADQGEVIHLRFAAGLGYVEIAEMLGVPVGTVRSRLHRGLATLRGLIEEWKWNVKQ